MGVPKSTSLQFTWLADLGAMIDNDTQIQVRCDKCGVFKRFTREDLVALAEKVGRDFTLKNRRCRCRLTAGCDGWNKFDYLLGVYRPFKDVDWVWR